MLVGYHRLQVRHPGPCHRCGAPIPVHAVAYWRPKPSLLERLLCEACYVLLSRRRQTDAARALQVWVAMPKTLWDRVQEAGQ